MSIVKMRLSHIPAVLLVTLVVGCATTNTVVRQGSDLKKYRRVAILPFQAQSGGGDAMADAFVTQFMAAGFSVVERRQIEAIFKELGLNMSGVLSQREVKEVGKMAHADALVFGSMEASYQQAYYIIGGYAPGTSELHAGFVSLRMVDVETGEVVLTSTFENGKAQYARGTSKIPGIMMDDIRSKLLSGIRMPNLTSP